MTTKSPGPSLTDADPTITLELDPLAYDLGYQGAIQLHPTGEVVMAQSRGALGPSEHSYFHLYDKTGRHLSTMTLPHGGHVSSFTAARDSDGLVIGTDFVAVDKRGNTIRHDIAHIRYSSGSKTRAHRDVRLVDVFTPPTRFVGPCADLRNGLTGIRTVDGDGAELYTRRRDSDITAKRDLPMGTVGPFKHGTRTFQGMAMFGNSLFLQTGESNGKILIDHHRWDTGAKIETLNVSGVGLKGREKWHEGEGIFVNDRGLFYVVKIGAGANKLRLVHLASFPPISLTALTAALKAGTKPATPRMDFKAYQRALNLEVDAELKVDGWPGAMTRAASARLQSRVYGVSPPWTLRAKSVHVAADGLPDRSLLTSIGFEVKP